MTENRGGKREGAGRPKGATSINAELRDKFREHSESAINALVDVMQDADHPDRLKAAALVLERGYGKTTEHTPAESIIERFMSGEISAIQATLLLEANQLPVSRIMQRYFDNEIHCQTHKSVMEFNVDPERLPVL